MLRIKGDREVPLFFFTGLPEKAIDRRAPAGEKPNGNQPSRDSVVDPVAIGVILILPGSSTEKRVPSNLFSNSYGQRAALAALKHLLNRLGLQLNETKTKTGNAWEGSFDFLGFEIRMNRSYRSGKSYPHVQPGKKAVKRIKAKLTELTGKNRTPFPLPVIVQQVNQVLRGWSGYFHYRNCTKVLGGVRWHTDERLRTHLRKRYKVRQRGKGYKRFPSKILYQRYGLFKLPATAPWRRAHALT